MAVCAPTCRFVRENRHVLPDGMALELLHLPAAGGAPSTRPPLLFVHGSYHGAWCWQVCMAASMLEQSLGRRGSRSSMLSSLVRCCLIDQQHVAHCS